MIAAADVLAAIREAPFVDLGVLMGCDGLLVLAPHADDESLACGGLIAEALVRGRDVHVAILTDGTFSHPDSPSFPPARLKALRESEAREAVAALGLPPDRLHFLEQIDASAPHSGAAFDALADRVTRWARRRRIGTIVTTWRHDPHCDHEAASFLAAEVARRVSARHWEAPVWGWTLADDTMLPEVSRAVRLDIRAHLGVKRQAIAVHRSQITGLIADSPCGFRLDPAFLALFDRTWEGFLEA